MTPPAMHVDSVTHISKVLEREAGSNAALRSLVRRRTHDVRAMDNITFSLEPGELPGFLGSNRAGMYGRS